MTAKKSSKKASTSKTAKKAATRKPAKTTSTAKPAKRPAAKAKTKAKTTARKSTPPKAPASKRPAAVRKAATKTNALTPAQREREKARLKKEREREKALLKKEREAEALKKEREREKLANEREKARLKKEQDRERARLEKEKAKAKALKEREQEKLRKEQEREKALLKKEREAEAQKKAEEREAAKQAREEERARKVEEREAAKKAREEERARKIEEREAAKKAREEERVRKAEEREAERKRREEERVRKAEEREAERKRREEERAEKAAKLEAYKKAKAAEQAKLRAEKEAARRALESKIARATRRAQRSGSRPAMAARAYRPDAIPDQSGTRRYGANVPASTRLFANLRTPEQLEQMKAPVSEPPPSGSVQAPAPPPLPAERTEERFASLEQRLHAMPESFQQDYRERFDMSWIYHDSHLEGVVYSYQELRTAIDPNITVVPDSSLQPVCEEIRRHKAAIDLARELATKKRVPISVDMVKRFYITLHPEEGDVKSVAYRKDIPQHRLYFHEYAAPDRLAYKVRQAIEWLSGPEPKKIHNPVRIAARVHYDLVRAYPFPVDSGKVARLIMNVILMRAGYPPAIIHSTERQRYYESLKGSLPVLINMIQESLVNGLESIEKLLDERESRKRAFVT